MTLADFSFKLKISIKTRVWLLGGIILGGMLGLMTLHYQLSEAQLLRHAAFVDQLQRAGQHAAAIHELQRERGLSNGYLSSGDPSLYLELLDQYARSDRFLEQREVLRTLQPETRTVMAVTRRRVAAGEAGAHEVSVFYTEQIERLLSALEHQALALGGHPLQNELVAHGHLSRAKEFFGQARATLMAMPLIGRADRSWVATMGRDIGLFDWYVARFFEDGSAVLADELRATLMDSDMLRARGLIESALTTRDVRASLDERRLWYATLSVAMDRLFDMEQRVFSDLQARARVLQNRARMVLWLERLLLLAITALVLYLAVSSLRRLLRALEAALGAARRVGGGRRRGGQAGPDDEIGEIAQGYGHLLDLVDRLSQKAATDALTGALNRHGFLEIASEELQRARRHRRPLSLIEFDLDHFKRVNDEFGHAVGDRVLQTVSRLVQENLRLTDVFARWGGEEFVILVPETTEIEAARLADKLRVLFREYREDDLPVFTASFGVAGQRPEEGSFEALFERVDRALYLAKQSGRDRVECFSPSESTATVPS